MTLRLSLQIPLDAGYIRTTRLLSRCLLQDMNVSSPIIDDVETIVAELCANVIFHAQSKATYFLVTLEYRKPQVIITVADEGEGFAQADVLPAGTSRPDGTGGERYGGYGLSLIEGLSDKLDFTATDPHGTTVRVEKNLHFEIEGVADEAAEWDTDDSGIVTASKD